MPSFIYDNKLYYNPVELALHFIGGNYKMPIVWRLHKKTMRYTELKNSLPHLSHKTLSLQLRELEALGLISRKVYAVVPPKVEYSITKDGKAAIPVINHLLEYGLTIMQQKGIEARQEPKFKPKKSTKIKKSSFLLPLK